MNGDTLNFSSFMDMSELDVSMLKERGEALKEAIYNAVKDTQSLIAKPLPNVLIMTKEQFDDLFALELAEMIIPDGEVDHYKPKDHLWLTPMNIMDIVVKDAGSHSIT